MFSQDVGKLSALNPLTGKTDRLAAMLADRAQMQLMHMVTASPARTPNLIVLGDPAYIYRASASRADCAAPPACIAIDPDVSWVGGDIHARPWPAAGSAWRVRASLTSARRRTSSRIMPTCAPRCSRCVGLTDRYVHDGVVLVDMLESNALPTELASGRDTYASLARAYKSPQRSARPAQPQQPRAAQPGLIQAGDIGYQRYLDAIGGDHRPDATPWRARSTRSSTAQRSRTGRSMPPLPAPWSAAPRR